METFTLIECLLVWHSSSDDWGKPAHFFSTSPGLTHPRSVDNKWDDRLPFFLELLRTMIVGVALSLETMMGSVSEVWHAMLTPTVVCGGWIGSVPTLTTLSSTLRASSSLTQLVLSWWQGSKINGSTYTTFEDPSGQLQKPSQPLRRDWSNR